MMALKLFRAELVRSILLLVRYPIEFVVGLGILYSLFMGLFLGARSLVQDPRALGASLDAFVISYVMWFFVISAMGRLAFQIQDEAQAGVLEQLFLNYPRMLVLLFVRCVVDFFESFAMVVLLLVLIMATTGRWITLTWPELGEVVLLFVITVAGIYGFGLIFAGMALVFKRLGQLGAITQFAFFLIAYLPLGGLALWLRILLYCLPLSLGVQLIKLVAVQHYSAFSATARPQLLGLIVNSVAYLLVGALIFSVCERKAKLDGRLGQY
jgi:ABC-2 type transport system permease protein